MYLTILNYGTSEIWIKEIPKNISDVEDYINNNLKLNIDDISFMVSNTLNLNVKIC